jgi:hypothetical protein
VKRPVQAASFVAIGALALVACSPSSPPLPTPEPFTALHVVRTGPYPLYEHYGEWLTTRAASESTTRLHSGCLFDVQSTRPDQGEMWAYGKVYRCDELVTDGPPAPQMGVRPLEVRIYDGRLGYFPMRLLDPYQGPPPARR